MLILYAPFAAKAPSLNGSGSPKDYPHAKELADLLIKEHQVIQVGGLADQPLVSDFRSNLSFSEVGELIRWADTGICVDSYLQHHMWLLQAWGGNRALYHRRSLLILDEATSALDIATEAKLFEALHAALRTNSRSSWRPTASALLPAVIKWLI